MSSGSQTPLCFIDTNIWLYAFIPSQDPHKSIKARAVIQHSDIIISPQVIVLPASCASDAERLRRCG
jgi:predicted nucleic acid-binding protein